MGRERGSESFFFSRFPSPVQSMPALSPHEMTTPLSIHPLSIWSRPTACFHNALRLPSPQVSFNGLLALECSYCTSTSVSYSKVYQCLTEGFFCLSHIHSLLSIDPPIL